MLSFQEVSISDNRPLLKAKQSFNSTVKQIFLYYPEKELCQENETFLCVKSAQFIFQF